MAYEPKGQRTIATHAPYELREVAPLYRPARWMIRRRQGGRTYAVADVYAFAEWCAFTRSLVDGGGDETAAVGAMDGVHGSGSCPECS